MIAISINVVEGQNRILNNIKPISVILHTRGGLTTGIDNFEQTGLDNSQFKRKSSVLYNWGIGATAKYKKGWVYSIDIGKYHPSLGAQLVGKPLLGFNRDLQQIIINLDYVSSSFRLGKVSIINNSNWQHKWLIGIDLLYIDGRGLGGTGGVANNVFARQSVLVNPNIETQSGIAPAAQAGYQIAFRGKRMGISLMILGNLGLKRYGTQHYEAWLDNQEGKGIQNVRGSFIATLVQYEVFLNTK
jgi:hypothetical protein